MMVDLVFDVSEHFPLLRWAYSKCAKTILPTELVNQTTGFIDVFAGAGFQLTDKFGNRDFCWNANQ